jgi:hypothetical protein
VRLLAVSLQLSPAKPTGLEAYKVKTEVLLNVFFIVVQLAPQVKEVSTAWREGVARFPHPNG